MLYQLSGDILSFFSKFGTHGLDKAIFGMSVNSNILMKEDVQAEAYQEQNYLPGISCVKILRKRDN